MKVTIVGGGISGLATAQAILQRDPDAEVSVLESASRVGGKVYSELTPEGYLCEWGVNGFLDKVPETLDLCCQVGVEPVRADEAAKRRFIFSESQLHQLPEKPPQFFTSNLLSFSGRMRVIGELFASGTDVEDETLAAFATRRLGPEAAQKLIDPMASGVFAGDSSRLSLKSCFPRIHEVEAEYGSLIRGLIKLQKKARKQGAKNKPGPGPGGTLTSFDHGMSELTDTLAAQLGSRVQLGATVAGLSPSSVGYTVYLADGSEQECEALVLAVPAYTQSRILHEMDADLSGLLEEIEYPALTVVCLGYPKIEAGKGPDGFGFLVPSVEERTILGTVVDSNVFPGRAPEGKSLLRCMVGGARSSLLAELPEQKLIDCVRADLKDMTGLDADPEFVKIYRHETAIPQYQVGHAARLEAIADKLHHYPGLVLTGNAYRGVSLNDCVANARKVAEALVPASEVEKA